MCRKFFLKKSEDGRKRVRGAQGAGSRGSGMHVYVERMRLLGFFL